MIKFLAKEENLTKFIIGVGMVASFGLGLVSGLLISIDLAS